MRSLPRGQLLLARSVGIALYVNRNVSVMALVKNQSEMNYYYYFIINWLRIIT